MGSRVAFIGMNNTNQSPTRSWRTRAPAVLLAAIFLGIVATAVALRLDGTGEAADERDYHLPVVQGFLDQWRATGRVNIVEYESATSPGYHLLMAAVLGVTGSAAAMNIVNAAIGLGLVLAVYAALRRVASPWSAFILSLPVALNHYVLGASIWLTTDATALLFVTLALGAMVMCPWLRARALRAGVWSMLAVFVRQVHIWSIAPIALAGAMNGPRWSRRLVRAVLGGEGRAGNEPSEREGWMNLSAAALACVLPVVLLGVFVWLWGGLIPKAHGAIVLHAGGPNAATPAFALALTGAVGVFLLPLAWRQVRALRASDAGAIGAAAAGIVLALAVETSYSWKTRAYGWLWQLVERTPEVGGRSLVIAAAAPVGAIVLLVLFRSAREAGRGDQARVLLVALLGWVCAQSFNAMAWQRYFEPVILIGLAMLAALGMRALTPVAWASRVAWLGPLALAGCQATASALWLIDATRG